MSNHLETLNSDQITFFNKNTLKHAQRIYRITVTTAGRDIPFPTRDLIGFASNPVRGTITFVTQGVTEPRFHTYTTAYADLRLEMRETHPLIAESDRILKNDKS